MVRYRPQETPRPERGKEGGAECRPCVSGRWLPAQAGFSPPLLEAAVFLVGDRVSPSTRGPVAVSRPLVQVIAQEAPPDPSPLSLKPVSTSLT